MSLAGPPNFFRDVTALFEDTKYAKCYQIYNRELEHVFEEKDLGVIVDSDLSFEEHLSAKVRIANAIWLVC